MSDSCGASALAMQSVRVRRQEAAALHRDVRPINWISMWSTCKVLHLQNDLIKPNLSLEIDQAIRNRRHRFQYRENSKNVYFQSFILWFTTDRILYIFTLCSEVE